MATGTGGAIKTKALRKNKRTKRISSSLVLSCNDLLFINAYLSMGCNGVRAYQAVHPKVKYTSAEVSAHRLLSKDKIKAEIAVRMQVEGGITKAFIESNLMTALRLANEAKDAAVIASVSMDCAKLAGFLIDKHADVSPKPELSESDLAKALQARGYRAVPQQDSNFR